MKKGIIKIPLHEIWELTNKPHRFFKNLYDEVENYKVGEVEYLDFDKETKKKMLERIEKIIKTGKII